MRVLIIDDSRSVRLIVGGYLRDEGMQTVEAADGQAGLEQLRHNPDVRLVLVDWNMPVMDGLSFIKAVRAEPAYRSLKIIMATSESEQSQVIRALDAGANEYLMKPFTKDVLIAKLHLLDVFEE
ncbi:MAG: response regulator [Planctomycetia bacterium]|nr:response regulator [Planctomycetia bacterium]